MAKSGTMLFRPLKPFKTVKNRGFEGFGSKIGVFRVFLTYPKSYGVWLTDHGGQNRVLWGFGSKIGVFRAKMRVF